MTVWFLSRRREQARPATPAVLQGGGDAAPDETLVERLVAGEEAALRETYRLHRAPLARFCRRLVGDSAAADDLVHEVFVRVPRAVRRLKPGTPLGSFLIAVAVNHARHHVRAASRRRKAQTRLAQEPSPSAGTQPDGELERRQLAEALTKALDRLPIEQRVAFVLCAIEERTSVEAAALVGTSDTTMRARLFHAKRKLRLDLAPFDDGGSP